jgi:uncharacterized damage-inducible protein DinB
MAEIFTPAKLFLYLEELHHSNLACVDLVPEDKLDYKPAPELYTLKHTLHHMYANQRFFNLTAKSGRMDVSVYKRLMAEKPVGKAELRKFMEDVFSETKEVFRDKSIFTKQVGTIAGIRKVLDLYLGELEHQTHHRGQVYMMLRMLGIKPPESGYFMGLE